MYKPKYLPTEATIQSQAIKIWSGSASSSRKSVLPTSVNQSSTYLIERGAPKAFFFAPSDQKCPILEGKPWYSFLNPKDWPLAKETWLWTQILPLLRRAFQKLNPIFWMFWVEKRMFRGGRDTLPPTLVSIWPFKPGRWGNVTIPCLFLFFWILMIWKICIFCRFLFTILC